MIEAVRQLRGEAHPNVQVQIADLALAHGTGGSLENTSWQRNCYNGTGVNQMTVKQRTFPSPIADPDTEQFWTAAKMKLMVGSCNSCGEKHYYPRGICPHCGAQDITLVEASGKGEITLGAFYVPIPPSPSPTLP